MSLIIDASVVVKWVLAEDGSDRANALRHENGLMAPSQLVAEVGNALRKAIRRGDVAAADASSALGVVFRPFDLLVPNEALLSSAMDFAILLQHPVYDCFYLALAERERAPLVSADERLIRAGGRAKGVEVRAL